MWVLTQQNGILLINDSWWVKTGGYITLLGTIITVYKLIGYLFTKQHIGMGHLGR
jgi:hypothetical protein